MINYIIILILILLSALFSGLTLGLMGLNLSELKRKKSLGDMNAARVYKIRKKGNLLLTTLLVGNVAVNTTVSIFLGSITTGILAGLIATSLIVVFGEITPQAVFSRHALSLGSKLTWLVRIFIFIFYPITYPIAWVLDKTLGEELPTIYSKKELMKIIEEHEDAINSEVDADEEKILLGALSFSGKKVKDIMTPRSVMKTLDSDHIIDYKLLEELSLSSHSRFPVYKNTKDNIVGILFLRQLLGRNILGKSVGEVANNKPHFINESRRLDYTFRLFLKVRHHLFVVQDANNKVSGLITLENILEEIISAEIVDEADKHEDLRLVAKQLKENKYNAPLNK